MPVMYRATGLSLSGLHRRTRRSASVLWALLAALGPVGAPVLHSFEAQHLEARPSPAHAHVVESGGGLHERGCPHTPPAAHHDSGACLTCRTLQHSKFSMVGIVARPLAVAQPRASLIDEERSAIAWVSLSSSVPRAPPSFS